MSRRDYSHLSADYSSFKFFLVTFPTAGVAHVQINRPAKLNAFHEHMWKEFEEVFDHLSHDSEVRAVVLSGVGEKAFTVGLDVQAASEGSILSGSESTHDVARKAVAIRRHVDEFQSCIGSVERCEKPVICALHGFSFGLAIDIATCADVRICAEGTKFAVKEVDIGLAADIGTLTRLPKVVGNFSWVKEVSLTARIFGPEEAFRVGFVNQVLESKDKAIDAALKMAELISSKSPVAVQGTKEFLNYSRDNKVAESLRYTGVWNSAAIQTDDVSQALLSGIKKTTPKFSKL